MEDHFNIPIEAPEPPHIEVDPSLRTITRNVHIADAIDVPVPEVLATTEESSKCPTEGKESKLTRRCQGTNVLGNREIRRTTLNTRTRTKLPVAAPHRGNDG